MTRNSPIKALGELGLRVNDLEKMRAFYCDVIGLEVFDDPNPNLVFLRIADAVEGHPLLLALFDRETSVEQERSTLDHFAFLIDRTDYDATKERIESRGVPVFPKTFPHRGWRSLFVYDPEGNTVEFVCYDESVREG